MLGHLSHHDFEREGEDKSAMVFGGGVNIGDNICQKRVGDKESRKRENFERKGKEEDR
jgi:hypothetical protein